MDYICRHGASDIQMPDPVGRKWQDEELTEKSGDTKRRYEEARHLVGAPQGGVSENMEKLPRQGSSTEKTPVGIKSWAAIQEEKWRRVPKQLEEKIQKNKKTVKKGLHRPMIMDGGKGKKLIFFVLLRILNIRKR